MVLLSACSLFDQPDQGSAATRTTAAKTPEPTPTLVPEPEPTESPADTPPTSLTVWVNSDLSIQSDNPGGSLIAEQITAFENSHPGLSINVEVKNPTGLGGTMSYLRSGHLVAPSLLPDLIVLPTSELATAAAEEIIFPLDGRIESESMDDLYPPGRTLAEAGGTIFGFPYSLSNITHLAYGSDIFTDTVPVNWGEISSQDSITFTFPAGGNAGAELALQFYLASGGRIINEPGQPPLEVEPLTLALGYFNQGIQSGFIAPESNNLVTFDEVYQIFDMDAKNVILTNRELFDSERRAGAEIEFATVPGPEGPLQPLVKGLVWAVSATDPDRQELAVELLNWLIAAPNMGEWSIAANQLPARRTAFDLWSDDDRYVAFLKSQLEEGGAYPSRVNQAMLDALRVAVNGVIAGNQSPQDAAAAAVESLSP